jgi:hypothetical protein
MATVFRLRWLVTVHLLELALRVVFLVALFMRPAAARAVKALPSRPVGPRP